MQMAGIPRSETVIWNTGPGWDRDIANSARTARRDAALLRGFVEALPRLEVVVLVGGVARRYAGPVVAERRFLTFETVHPYTLRRSHWSIICNWLQAANDARFRALSDDQAGALS